MSNDIRRPNLFIVGAPKCGTTSLAAWLSEHPQIFMSSPKEPKHFDTDIVDRRSRLHPSFRGREEYENLFKLAGPKQKAVGEATTRYLFSSVAIANILQYNPDARMIAMVRNPIDMVVSMHGHMLFHGKEDVADPEQAWSLQAERAKGLHVPRLCQSPEMLQYGPIFCIGAQIKRMFELVPGEQRYVLVLDDLRAKPIEEWKRLLRFLQLDYEGRTQFPVYNVTRRRRSQKVDIAIKTLREVKTALRLPRFDLPILKKLDAFNSFKKTKEPISPKFREELKEYFRGDIELLGALLEHDFSGWLRA
jgi:hypothetical protein